jgi:hypothetical protein
MIVVAPLHVSPLNWTPGPIVCGSKPAPHEMERVAPWAEPDPATA